MAGSWKTFNISDMWAGTFTADVMLLLTDGSVLVHNGYRPPASLSNASQWLRLWPDNNGNYETGTWSNVLNMQYARQGFASGVLADGRVFVIGGQLSTDPTALGGYFAQSGEIFDPQADEASAWSALDKPADFYLIRGDCNGSVLADGRVLLGAVSGGFPADWPRQTAIWDSNISMWTQAGLSGMPKKDPFAAETFCLLPDASVLAPAAYAAPKAQRYLPSLDQWVDCEDCVVQLPATHIKGGLDFAMGPIILLPNGEAFVIGSSGLTALYTPPTDPTGLGSWAQGPTFPQDTSTSPNWPTLTALHAPACLLPNGKVVCMGGNAVLNEDFHIAVLGFYLSQNPVLLEYDPAATATTLQPLDVQPDLPVGNYTSQSFFLLLPTGQMLLSAQANTLFLYTPDPATSAPQEAWRPTILSVPGVMVPGDSYTISGTQFNGLSQAVCAGTRAGMATNYPIVQLTNQVTKQVVYARSYNFSAMGVATGTAVQSCTIDIPSYLANELPPDTVSLGDWNLVVIANGIPSEPVTVNLRIYPCQGIIDNPPDLGDYDTLAEYHEAISAWLSQVKACLKEYGQLP